MWVFCFGLSLEEWGDVHQGPGPQALWAQLEPRWLLQNRGIEGTGLGARGCWLGVGPTLRESSGTPVVPREPGPTPV